MASTYETFKGLAYKSALIDSFNKTSKDLMAVDQAKQKLKQDKELHDLNKKKISTELEILNRAGQLDDAQFQVNKKILANESNIINKKLENQNLQIEQTNQRLKGDLSSIVSQAKSLAVISQSTGTSLKSDAAGNITFEASQPTAIDAAKNRTAMLTDLEKQVQMGIITPEQARQKAQQYAPQQASLRSPALFNGEPEPATENVPMQQGQQPMTQSRGSQNMASQGQQDLVMTDVTENVLGVPEKVKRQSIQGLKEVAMAKESTNPIFKKAGQAMASLPELAEVAVLFDGAVEQMREVMPSALEGTTSGELSRWVFKHTKQFRQDALDKVVAYQKKSPVLARKLAKASGEVRISDQDAKAFLNAIMNFEENALGVNINLAESQIAEIEATARAAARAAGQEIDLENNPALNTMKAMVASLRSGGAKIEGNIEDTQEIDPGTQFDQLYSQYTGGK